MGQFLPEYATHPYPLQGGEHKGVGYANQKYVVNTYDKTQRPPSKIKTYARAQMGVHRIQRIEHGFFLKDNTHIQSQV